MMKNSQVALGYHLWRIPTFSILFILAVIMGVISQFDIPDMLFRGKEIYVSNYIQNTFTILLAAVIGSIIGWERESRNRPAGLRTYSLVCVGSAIVMITSFEIFEQYHQLANFDPARLGAQVISGIGFLGAGTIIRNQFSVKGLTTAASLWVVGCLGLTIGSKLYLLSIIVSFIVYYILHNLRTLDELKGESINYEITINIMTKFSQMAQIQKVVDKYTTEALHIVSIVENTEVDEDKETTIVIQVTVLDDYDEYNMGAMIMELYKIKDIVSVYCKEIH